MREKPYHVINTETNETVAWVTYEEWVLHYCGKPNMDVLYRPGRKKKVKK